VSSITFMLITESACVITRNQMVKMNLLPPWVTEPINSLSASGSHHLHDGDLVTHEEALWCFFRPPK